MKSLYQFSAIYILITSSLNFPRKEEFAKNSNSKVIVIELDDNNNFLTLNTFRIKPPQIIKKIPPRFNTITHSTSKQQTDNIVQPNSLSPTNFGTYVSPHTTSLVKRKTKPLNSNSKHAITSSKPYRSARKVIAFAANIGYSMRKPYGKGFDGGQVKGCYI